MAHLRRDSSVSRRLLRKFASMGMFYQRIRRYHDFFTKKPILWIGDNRLSGRIRVLYTVSDLSCVANMLLTIANAVIARKRLLDYDEVKDICIAYRYNMTVEKLLSIRYPFGWRLARFALFYDNQCIIVEAGDVGYEIIGYYIKASYFKNLECVPENYLPKYRSFGNFL